MPIAILAVWRILKPLWPYLAVALAVLAVLRIADRHGYHSRDAAFAQLQQRAKNSHDAFVMEQANFRASVASWRKATADAQAADKAHADQIARTDAAISKEKQNALTKQLAVANDRADAYSRRMLDNAAGAPGQAAGGAGSIPSVRGASDAAGAPDGADRATVVADNRACAAAVTIATGWQDWWRSVAAAPGRE